MRMIDADALAEAMGVKRLMIQSWKADSAWGVPIVDAEPVARCKNCKYSEHWYGDRNRCFLWVEDGIGVFEDGFCSYGERRGGGE